MTDPPKEKPRLDVECPDTCLESSKHEPDCPHQYIRLNLATTGNDIAVWSHRDSVSCSDLAAAIDEALEKTFKAGWDKGKLGAGHLECVERAETAEAESLKLNSQVISWQDETARYKNAMNIAEAELEKLIRAGGTNPSG